MVPIYKKGNNSQKQNQNMLRKKMKQNGKQEFGNKRGWGGADLR